MASTSPPIVVTAQHIADCSTYSEVLDVPSLPSSIPVLEDMPPTGRQLSLDPSMTGPHASSPPDPHSSLLGPAAPGVHSCLLSPELDAATEGEGRVMAALHKGNDPLDPPSAIREKIMAAIDSPTQSPPPSSLGGITIAGPSWRSPGVRKYEDATAIETRMDAIEHHDARENARENTKRLDIFPQLWLRRCRSSRKRWLSEGSTQREEAHAKTAMSRYITIQSGRVRGRRRPPAAHALEVCGLGVVRPQHTQGAFVAYTRSTASTLAGICVKGEGKWNWGSQLQRVWKNEKGSNERVKNQSSVSRRRTEGVLGARENYCKRVKVIYTRELKSMAKLKYYKRTGLLEVMNVDLTVRGIDFVGAYSRAYDILVDETDDGDPNKQRSER
ncbi:hypothetical protein EDB83DRAFT_2318813 [Lactarius deliciosus]|nr:hypothetical protein EDB83DRAFT_2318813 [Lactarius deliciosus]